MWNEAKYNLTSDCPMIMHAATTVDPLHPLTKALKQVSGKRKKTDSDHEEMARIEFIASLYIDDNGPVISADCMEACLIGAAKTKRQGKDAKSGMMVVTHFPLEYVGPQLPDQLWLDENFRFVKRVRVGTASIMRTRPIFREWSATVTVMYEDGVLDRHTIDEWMTIAGSMIGLCDWRPRYGRFTATNL